MLNASQVNLQFSFGPVPIRSLDFRGRLGADGRFAPGASVYGQVTCASVPNYSVYLYIAGVCNPSDTLASYGTFLSDGYDARRRQPQPKGVRAGDVTLQAPTATADGEAVAQLRLDPGARYRAAKHLASILLVDAETGEPGQPRLPHPDHAGHRRQGQHPRGPPADPGGDGAAGARCRPT